ncbi:MAG: hypothetical protein MI920_35490 [Kiloniellales bacterium]|nr:hypothetical protein [Kiloniellales bacterium]
MDPGALAKMVGELLLAISLHSGYPVPAEPPRVEFLPHAELEQRACEAPCSVLGWFPPGDTVFLDDRLDPLGNLAARGILLHELVHYVQQENEAFANEPECERWLKREEEAFDVQIRWLAENRAPLYALGRDGKLPLQIACSDDGSSPLG